MLSGNVLYRDKSKKDNRQSFEENKKEKINREVNTETRIGKCMKEEYVSLNSK